MYDRLPSIMAQHVAYPPFTVEVIGSNLGMTKDVKMVPNAAMSGA